MKKYHAPTCLAMCLAGLFLFGCAMKRPSPNAQVSFDVPSKLSIIKKGAEVRLAPTQESERQTPGFAPALAAQLNEAGYFKVNSGAAPDYVIGLNTFWADRCDDSGQARYNLRYVKRSKNTGDGGGYEYLDTESGASFTGALLGSVTIYEVSDMRPLAYFNVLAVDTKWAKSPGSGTPAPPCDAKGLQRDLMAQITANIRNLLSREQRNIGVIIPSGGDLQAKRMILAGRHKEAAERLKTLLPDTPLDELSPDLYAKWEIEAEAAQTAPRDMEADLANAYLLLMAQEARGVSEQSVRQIHDGYARIILLTSDKDMIDASADSLSRVEENAKRLGMEL